MTVYSEKRTAAHLMNVVNMRNGEIPNFSLLLGSGASKTSGVKTAQDMIEEWNTLLSSDITHLNEGDEITRDHLSFNRFDSDDEYSVLFETIFDQPSQRRNYIEECVKDAHPGWGYVYLTSLLANRIFDVVFTTNFDDLINEACYLYSERLRPIVAAHDSVIQGIRVTSSRPKIIKLHGDFLYDNIKNTISELETLEVNTKRKLSQFAKEYGLIVLGYSGRDRSVMDTLDLLLRDNENYRHGVYWCIRRKEEVPERLKSLLKRDRVYLVEIEGFDEFMAELHHSAGLALPKSVAQPLEMAADRVRLITSIEGPLRSHPVIDAHINEALDNIKTASTRQPIIPLAIAGTIFNNSGQFDEAIAAWKMVRAENSDNHGIAYQYATALAGARNQNELIEFLDESVSNSMLSKNDHTYFLLKAGINEKVVEIADYYLSIEDKRDDSNPAWRLFVRINRAIALKRLGQKDEMRRELETLEHSEGVLPEEFRAGIAALKGNRKEMFSALRGAVNKTISARALVEFPVFEDYQDDAEFQQFIAGNLSPNPPKR